MRRRVWNLLFALVAVGASGEALAQRDLTGRGEYPQFRGLSGLPGGGFGVRPDGRLGYDGAMAFSTPVAYALKGGRSAFAFSSISRDSNLRFGNSGSGDANTDANGTAVALYGVDAGFGRFMIGGMLYSGLYDSGFNLHFTPKQGDRPLQFAVGVQDIAGQGGTSGGELPGDSNNSTSTYIVGTTMLRGGTSVSAGFGSGRFRTPFANLSAPLFGRARAVAEYDGFSVNAFFTYSPSFGRLDEFGEEKEGGMTFSIGVVRAKYATVAVALHF